MIFIGGRQAGLRSERPVSIGQAGPQSAISAYEQKMIRRNHDFPPQSGFVGSIDDVNWYHYALSASAVQALYERYDAGKGASP